MELDSKKQKILSIHLNVFEMYKIAVWLKEDENLFGEGRQYRPFPREKLATPPLSKGRGWQYRPFPRGEAGNTVPFQGKRLAIPSSSPP
jgi:hypothetical protein